MTIALAWSGGRKGGGREHGEGIRIASLSGHSHLKYLITNSMQTQRGKAWEISLRVVSSGRQRVDTQGTVPDKESRSLYYQSKGWTPQFSKAVSLLLVVGINRDHLTRNYCQAPPPMCLPSSSVYLT